MTDREKSNIPIKFNGRVVGKGKMSDTGRIHINITDQGFTDRLLGNIERGQFNAINFVPTMERIPKNEN